MDKETIRFSGILFFVMLCINTYALDIQVNAGYLFDLLVTSNWDHELIISHPITGQFTLKETVQYLDVTQDSISGIRRLNRQAVSGLAGFSWITLWNYALIDMSGGVDYVLDNAIKPRLEFKINSGIPIPLNGIIAGPHLTAETWYRNRIVNAAVVANRIASYGFALDFTASLLSRLDAGMNYRNEFLRPENIVLDTSLKEPVTGGVPPDTLPFNAIRSFYMYVSTKVVEGLHLGYAFSVSNSDIDRMVATRSEPLMRGFPPQLAGTTFEYTYYPYPTPRHTLSHIAIVSGTVPIGRTARWEAKAAMPVFSRCEAFSKPDFIPAGEPAEIYRFYYKQYFTGPLLMSTKLFFRVGGPLSVKIEYEYFCLPYREWAYFTNDSYSYNKITTGVRLGF